jgi:hypothetical protein
MASLREPRDYRPLVIGLIRNLLAKHSSDYRYTDKIAQGRISLLYLPLIQFAIENIKEIDATAKVVSEAPDVAATMSLGVTWAALSTYNFNSIKTKQTYDSQQNSILNETEKSDSTNPDKPSPISTPLAEKLSKCEARDILISVLFVLSKIPKKMLSNIWRLQETKGNSNGLIDFLHLLELSLQMFAYPGKNYLLKQQAKKRYLQSKAAATVNFQFNEKTRTPSIYGGSDLQPRTGTMDSQNSTATTEPPSSSSLPIDGNEEIEGSSANALAFFKECSLTQEIAITILDIAQTVSTQLSIRCNNLTTEATDIAFNKLLLLYIRLLDESWPENVRLNSLASLSIFISHFTSKFFYQGPMEPLSVTIEAMLLQLNSRYPRIQQASAALLQAILRKGYEVIFEQRAKEAAIESVSSASKKLSKSLHKNYKGIEILGRPGAQTSVALARLLGQRVPLATSPYFDRGLSALEALIVSQSNEKKLSPFEAAVMELISKLRGVLSATGALSEAADDPIRLAELHIQLADSYRGSARLRCTWFDTLAETHINEGWIAEASVCMAHSIVIIAKELSQKQLITVDWSLLDFINERIILEENVGAAIELDNTQQAGFTLDSLTDKVEATIQTLILAERYEAIGPIARLAIPIYEKLKNFKALVSLYSELQQAYSRAGEVKASGKRHLGTYFRVVFYGKSNFG